jgi:GTP-binding protein YchF
MKLGLIGLPNSGKTTIFNALTKSEAQVTAYASEKAEPNLAVVEVLDNRITHLSAIYKPRKTVYATIEIIDFVGFSGDSCRGSTPSMNSMGLIKNTDALALVVRNFRDVSAGSPDPFADIKQMNEEMLLSDMLITESRLERIAWSYTRGKKTNDLQREEKTLQKILEQLNNDRPIRDLELNKDEEKAVHGFQFLTKKPLMVILNSDEMIFGKNQDLLDEIRRMHDAIEFAGKFEMELSLLEDEQETKLFMEEMGIKASARDRLTRMAFETLGYISFFTVGSDEVRAWNISKGETALEAAATIHTDLARGFIRAECFSYADSVECGSEKGIRENGRFRLEGKNYRVHDGDILNIRFNV